MMQQMADGEMHVLVCTTIIETGIDIPNVNTLIIEDADRLGLSQLHQIRGRIGRSARRAYAYLTYRPGKVLHGGGRQAAGRHPGVRRPSAPASASPCGTWRSGARAICWGRSSPAIIMSVGYDMYLKLLEEAVLEQQGRGAGTSDPDCAADLATVERPHPGKVRPLRPAADGPVPPDGGHPHAPRRPRTWWTS